MSEGEIFREVDEELRRERMEALWKRYGGFVLAGAIAIVIAVAGREGWNHWQTQKAEDAGLRLVAAEKLIAEGKIAEATPELERFVADGPAGYRELAQLRLAADQAAAGKVDEAVAAYDAFVAGSSNDSVLRDYARIAAAELRVDAADFTEMQNRLNDIAGGTSAWRNSARELLGLSAYKAGDLVGAEQRLTEVLTDQATPQGLRRRAEMMMALIVSESAKAGGERAKSGAAGDAAGAVPEGETATEGTAGASSEGTGGAVGATSGSGN